MKNKLRGSLTAEVALGLPVLLIVLFTWFDLSVMTYSMGVIDHAFTIAVMKSKKLGDSSNSSTVNYQDHLLDELENSGGVLWKSVVLNSSIETNVYYFNNLATFVSCNKSTSPISQCADKSGNSTENAVNMPLAVYQLNFEYQPLFNYFLPSMKISREIIAVQEYERCTFKLGKGAGCAN